MRRVARRTRGQHHNDHRRTYRTASLRRLLPPADTEPEALSVAGEAPVAGYGPEQLQQLPGLHWPPLLHCLFLLHNRGRVVLEGRLGIGCCKIHTKI